LVWPYFIAVSTGILDNTEIDVGIRPRWNIDIKLNSRIQRGVDGSSSIKISSTPASGDKAE